MSSRVQLRPVRAGEGPQSPPSDAVRSAASSSVEPNEDPAPTASAAAVLRATGRRSRRASFSAAAPVITGVAAWADSCHESRRRKPRRRAAASVAPLRETPGMSAHAWAIPSQRPSSRRPRRSSRVCGRPVGREPSPARPWRARRRSRPESPADVRSGRSNPNPTPAGRRGHHRATNDGRRRADHPRSRIASLPPPAGARSQATIADPAWAARPRRTCAGSGSSRAWSQPSSQGTAARWPEEDTGSSSVGPCRRPSTRARPRESPSAAADSPVATRRPHPRRRRALAANPPQNQVGRSPRTTRARKRVVDVLEVSAPAPPVASDRATRSVRAP